MHRWHAHFKWAPSVPLRPLLQDGQNVGCRHTPVDLGSRQGSPSLPYQVTNGLHGQSSYIHTHPQFYSLFQCQPPQPSFHLACRLKKALHALAVKMLDTRPIFTNNFFCPFLLKFGSLAFIIEYPEHYCLLIHFHPTWPVCSGCSDPCSKFHVSSPSKILHTRT